MPTSDARTHGRKPTDDMATTLDLAKRNANASTIASDKSDRGGHTRSASRPKALPAIRAGPYPDSERITDDTLTFPIAPGAV
jgi:hypothetical protein